MVKNDCFRIGMDWYGWIMDSWWLIIGVGSNACQKLHLTSRRLRWVFPWGVNRGWAMELEPNFGALSGSIVWWRLFSLVQGTQCFHPRFTNQQSSRMSGWHKVDHSRWLAWRNGRLRVRSGWWKQTIQWFCNISPKMWFTEHLNMTEICSGIGAVTEGYKACGDTTKSYITTRTRYSPSGWKNRTNRWLRVTFRTHKL